jgi:hypothetical protein
MVKYDKFDRTSQTNPNRQRRTVKSSDAIVRKRTTNSAIVKKYNTKAKPTTNINKSAIMTLSKQVKALQLQRYGFRQFQHQHFLNPPYPHLNYISPTVTLPHCFLLNDFYTGTKIYRGTVTGGAPTLESPLEWTKVISDLDIGTQYLWNNKQQQDTVSSIHYLPISTTIRLRVEYQSNADFVRPIRVRMQVFKFKNQTVNGKFTMSLPYNLGAYWHMCDRMPSNRNHLNTAEYHDVVIDKSVYLTPSFNHTGTTVIDKYLDCKVQFPAKEVKLDLTADPTEQKVYNVIPTNEQYWCLISSDSDDIARLKVFGERWNVWRDANGVGS